MNYPLFFLIICNNFSFSQLLTFFFFFNFVAIFLIFFHFKSHILILPFHTPFCLLPSPYYFHFKLYFSLSLPCFYSLLLFLLPIKNHISQNHISSLQSPDILFFEIIFLFFPSLLFCPFVSDIAAIVVLLQYFTIFYFKPRILLSPFLISLCLLPSLSYLCLKFYFFPFFSLVQFHTIVICPPVTLSTSFSFPLIISYSFFTFLQNSYSFSIFIHLYSFAIDIAGVVGWEFF